MDVITRLDAFKTNQRKYFTGRPCKRGHVTARYVKTGACIDCIAVYGKNTRNKFSKGDHPRRHQIIIELDSLEDVNVLRAYAIALNFERSAKLYFEK